MHEIIVKREERTEGHISLDLHRFNFVSWPLHFELTLQNIHLFGFIKNKDIKHKVIMYIEEFNSKEHDNY